MLSVSSLKMHPLHAVASDPRFSFYTQSDFDKKALTLSLDAFNELILKPLRAQSADFIQARTLAALQQSRKNHDQYGINDANKTTMHEACVEALTDGNFRKGSSSLYDKKSIRNQIKKQIGHTDAIDITLQMLPNKVNTPIKSRHGTLPCLSEVGSLLRLYEICRIAETLCEQHGHTQRFRFRAVMDGFRFQHALNIRGCEIINYQNALHWWLDVLNLREYVTLQDYENEIKLHTTTDHRLQHKNALFKNTHDNINASLNDIGFEATLHDLAQNDPFGEYEGDEGKLFKLFKSILYTYHHQDMEESFDNYDTYQHQYRDTLRNIYADGSMTHTGWESSFAKRTLWAATSYMSSVHADRQLLGDPVGAFYPDAIRMNLLPKKQQIGLNLLCTTRPDSLKPWHGVCLVRLSGDKTKLDSVSRLYAEGIGAIPVILDPHDHSIHRTPLAPMQETGQTVFYIEPTVLLKFDFRHIFDNTSRFTR